MSSSENKNRSDEILKHYPLVVRIANYLYRRLRNNFSRDDLISFGLTALDHAITKYDASKGRFETFAGIRIRGAMYDEYRKLPEIKRGGGKKPQKKLDIIYTDKQFRNRAVDEPLTALDHLIEIEDAEHVRKIMLLLSELDQKILYHSFYSELPQLEIGKRLGLCESAVCLRRSKALRKMKLLFEGKSIPRKLAVNE